MSKPNRLGLYADVKQILDAALASNGGEFILSTHGEAVHWRQRAYRFRKAYAAAYGHSPYDILTLPRIDVLSKVVKIEVQHSKGIFRPADAPQSDIDEAAAELASRLLGKEIL